ncbi:kinase-like domain-containing protein [Pavlovales sp. CCMP2436]|nr:kinase-like domain-containing protein [Pavlovales sp. CCMP2436]
MRSLPGSLSIPIQRQPSGTRSAGPSPTPSPTTYRSGAAADLVRSGPLSPLVYSRLTRPRGGAAGSPNSPTSSRAHTADETFVSLLGRVSGAAVPAFPSPKGALRSPGSQGADAPAAAEDAPEAAPAPAEARRPRLDTQFVFPPHLAESYELIAPVGSGAFGTVWHAVHIESGEQVAIKVIERKKQLVEDFRLELNEAEILKSIAHPNIVRLKELASEPSGSDAFLIMELVDGGHLQAQLDEHGAYSDAEAVAIFRQVVSAIGYLHERNITHRDIKPENILFAREKEGAGERVVKLTDFGMSTMKDGKLTTRCGTPSYCAPELLLGDGYGKAVDMWSLGVLAYILVYGSLPFIGESRDELFENIIKGGYDLPSKGDVSDKAKDLIMRLLKANPMQRYTTRETLQHPWLTGSDDLESSYTSLVTVHEMMRSFNAERRVTLAVGAIVSLQRAVAVRLGREWPPPPPLLPLSPAPVELPSEPALFFEKRNSPRIMRQGSAQSHEDSPTTNNRLILPSVSGITGSGSRSAEPSPKGLRAGARRTPMLPPMLSEKLRLPRSNETSAPLRRNGDDSQRGGGPRQRPKAYDTL